MYITCIYAIIEMCGILIGNSEIMWQEARKQEKKIRGLMVDYKKRAERRREFYEKIVSDISC